MAANDLMAEVEAKMPWLRGLIGAVRDDYRGVKVIYCWHQEQITICGQCAPKADEAYLEYKQARKGQSSVIQREGA